MGHSRSIACFDAHVVGPGDVDVAACILCHVGHKTPAPAGRPAVGKRVPIERAPVFAGAPSQHLDALVDAVGDVKECAIGMHAKRRIESVVAAARSARRAVELHLTRRARIGDIVGHHAMVAGIGNVQSPVVSDRQSGRLVQLIRSETGYTGPTDRGQVVTGRGKDLDAVVPGVAYVHDVAVRRDARRRAEMRIVVAGDVRLADGQGGAGHTDVVDGHAERGMTTFIDQPDGAPR